MTPRIRAAHDGGGTPTPRGAPLRAARRIRATRRFERRAEAVRAEDARASEKRAPRMTRAPRPRAPRSRARKRAPDRHQRQQQPTGTSTPAAQPPVAAVKSPPPPPPPSPPPPPAETFTAALLNRKFNWALLFKKKKPYSRRPKVLAKISKMRSQPRGARTV